MTTYYVRKTGNDGSAGTSAETAWLTIDKAANEVSAGDTVRIGAGVYVESVTIDTDGSAGSEIEWHADIDGNETGDPGLVVIMVLDDVVSGTGSGDTLNLATAKWNEFYNIIFAGPGDGSGDYTLDMAGNSNHEGILFDTCVFLPATDVSNETIKWTYGVPGAITGNKPKFLNCVIIGQVEVTYDAMAAGDVACGVEFVNCLFTAQLSIDGPASSTNGITGYGIYNSTLLARIAISDQFNAGTTGVIANNVAFDSGQVVTIAGDGGTWTRTDNQKNGDSAESGFTTYCTNIAGFMVEPILKSVLGWSPYTAFELVNDQNGGGFESGGLEVGNATYAPSEDMYGNPRPMGRNVDDLGAGEARARPQQESTTVYEGEGAARFEGIGYVEFDLAVDAGTYTVSVRAQYDSNYTGTLPTLEVVSVPGASGGSDVMTGASGQYEELSVEISPTASGYTTVRLWSYDTSADGECFFDSLELLS
jgi:hypothetical protein